MATASEGQTYDSTGSNAFTASSDHSRARTLAVRCVSTNDALVNIPGIHKSGEFARVPIGSIEYFAIKGGIQSAFIKGDGGDTVCDCHVIVAEGY